MVVVDEVSTEVIKALASPSGGRLLVALPFTAGTDPWELLRAGAADVVSVAGHPDVSVILARLRRWAAVDELVDSEQVRAAAIGASACWRELIGADLSSYRTAFAASSGAAADHATAARRSR